MAIIEKLGDVLAADLDAGLNHLAMARCSTIERAKQLHQLYTAIHPQYRPVIVHSQQPLRERRENLAALRRFERSEEHTSELQSLMRISYAVFCLKKKKKTTINKNT